ncbi:MAG: type II toxin-antitoxin system VapC family toxin [Cytophagales bacterium]|nr:type II toxin-antitoxin system VapC family toxin [Cytophagales bacterium]
MSGHNILIDTNIIIYLFQGNQRIIDFLTGKQLYISGISEIEVLSFPKLTANETVELKRFIQQECIVVDLLNTVKDLTIEIRKGYSLKLPDAIIAATALYLKIPLFTKDHHFEKIAPLNLVLFE